ncbi:MAG TPA: hypothetical protein VFV58_03645 [Blastocatellia bacterium]|jgi:hypothetical protein|nr:hypothetical protein [Blastocatellia bacterium]
MPPKKRSFATRETIKISIQPRVFIWTIDAGVDIRKAQELPGHRHITTTLIYDKCRRTTAESASHDMPI